MWSWVSWNYSKIGVECENAFMKQIRKLITGSFNIILVHLYSNTIKTDIGGMLYASLRTTFCFGFCKISLLISTLVKTMLCNFWLLDMSLSDLWKLFSSDLCNFVHSIYALCLSFEQHFIPITSFFISRFLFFLLSILRLSECKKCH